MTTKTAAQPQAEKDAVRPFQIDIPDTALVDLRRRIEATRFPEKETVDDGSQGELAGLRTVSSQWPSPSQT